MNLILTGVGDKLHTLLSKNVYEKWNIQSFRQTGYIDASPVRSGFNAEGETKIDKTKLVYLTADSPNTITDLDPSDAYIIGGIVDRNRYLRLTLDRANEQGIRHGKLPISTFVSLTSSAVLTVNHVFQIMAY